MRGASAGTRSPSRVGPDPREDGRHVGRPARPSPAPPPPASREPDAVRTSRPPYAYVVDRRGLTIVGIVVVCLVGGFVGAAYDLSRGSHLLGSVTAVTFATAAIAAALVAHREDLGASVIVPPLAYAVVVFVAANVTSGGVGSYVRAIVEEAVVHILTSAPGLLVAFAGTALVAVVRFFAGRAAANRRRARARAARQAMR
jgi:hypothetical protein